MRISNLFVLSISFFIFLACNSPSGKPDGKMKVLPYYDLKGFLEQEIEKLDSVTVTKVSRINNEENQNTLKFSKQDWLEELDVFFRADINKPSLLNSFTTEVIQDYLIHRAKPEVKTPVKEIKVRIVNDMPVWITFKIAEENIFYTSYTLGELYMNNADNRIDHYSIETTQKIWFLKANNMKISGVIRD